MENPVKSLKQLSAAEEVAEEILRDKSEIIALDRRRNGNREGIRALMTQGSNKTWIALGASLIQMPSAKVKHLLEADQKATDAEINKLRSDLKVKVNKLRDLEYQDPVPGLQLNPLSNEEFNAVSQVLGHR